MILADLSKYKWHSDIVLEVLVTPTAQGRSRTGKKGRHFNPHSLQRKDFIWAAQNSLRDCREIREEILEDHKRFIHSFRMVYFEPMIKGSESHEPSMSARDIDNLEKFSMDALQGICYKNDNRVWCNLHAKLRGEVPKISILIVNHRSIK